MKIQEVLLRVMAKKDHVVAGGGDHRCDGPNDASLAGANRRTRVFRIVRRTERKAESKAGTVGDSREGAAVVSGGVLRPEHTTFSRKAERGTCHRAELCMGTESAARRWLGGETAQAWGAPAEKTALRRGIAAHWACARYQHKRRRRHAGRRLGIGPARERRIKWERCGWTLRQLAQPLNACRPGPARGHTARNGPG